MLLFVSYSQCGIAGKPDHDKKDSVAGASEGIVTPSKIPDTPSILHETATSAADVTQVPSSIDTTSFKAMLTDIRERKLDLLKDISCPILFPVEFSSIYGDIEQIGGGANNVIYRARLKQDRGKLKQGTTIVLQVSGRKIDKYIPRGLRAYAILSVLRDRNITSYIPEVYAAYIVPCPESLDQSKIGGSNKAGDLIFVLEMEYLESDYDKEYKTKPVPPRVAFEHAIGKYALNSIGKLALGKPRVVISITDPDGDRLDHYMLKMDFCPAVYHVKDKSYLFPAGYSSRQVDHDDYSVYKKHPSDKFNLPGGVITPGWFDQPPEYHVEHPSMKKFLAEINTKGLFQSIEDNLLEFEVLPGNPILTNPTVKHYYLEE